MPAPDSTSHTRSQTEAQDPENEDPSLSLNDQMDQLFNKPDTSRLLEKWSQRIKSNEEGMASQSDEEPEPLPKKRGKKKGKSKQ